MSRRAVAGVALTVLVAVAVVTTAVASRKDSASSRKALYGVLTGNNEIAGGDPDGFGSATATVVAADSICFGLVVRGLDAPTGAHIHSGKRGVNGPIVIPLTAPGSGSPGTSSACVGGIDTALVDDLLKHPGKYYWNVHTTAFPGGAIRGQLFTRVRHG
jgi:hypothetical protein